MELMPDEVRATLPPLYTQEENPDPTVYVKYFITSWTWYVTEFDGEDTLFGWVEGFEHEMGYFSLEELKTVRGPLGLGIERDLYFKPCKLSEATKGRYTPWK